MKGDRAVIVRLPPREFAKLEVLAKQTGKPRAEIARQFVLRGLTEVYGGIA